LGEIDKIRGKTLNTPKYITNLMSIEKEFKKNWFQHIDCTSDNCIFTFLEKNFDSNMDFNKFIKDKNITDRNINVVALIRRGGKILMGLREYKKRMPLWTFPGGRCEEGETIEETLIREIKEEIGVTDFNIIRFIGKKIGVKHGDKVYFFECKINQEPKLMEPKKFIRWDWISLENLPLNLIDQNDIKFLNLLSRR